MSVNFISDLAETNLKVEKVDMFLCQAEAFADRNAEHICNPSTSSSPKIPFGQIILPALVMISYL